MSLLTNFPAGYQKPEPLNKSFDMTVRDWSRQQFGGDAIVEEIRKALSTGVGGLSPASAYPSGSGDASALRLENLDNTMTSVLATAEHLKIFRYLHKEPSKQPYYQWNRRDSYGSTRGFFGFAEGGLPNGGQGKWTRNGAYVKFLGTRGGVTHPVVLTNILGGMSMDPVAEDQLGRTMDFMQRVERAILHGDDNIKDNSRTDSNYDGLLKQLTVKRHQNIIDLKGAPLNLDSIANAATKLVTEGKLLSFQDLTLFMSPQNIEDMGKLRWQTLINAGTGAVSGAGTTVDRADLTTSARENLIAGLSVVGQATSFGVIPFEWSIFTEPVESGLPLDLAGGSADAGAPDGTTSIVVATETATASGFTTKGVDEGSSDTYVETGTNFPGAIKYWYAVSAVNDNGESLMTIDTASPTGTWTATPAANDSNGLGTQVKITITHTAGTKVATAFRIYRCASSGSTSPAKSNPNWRMVGYTHANSTGTGGVFLDRNGSQNLYNNFMPDTNVAPLICRNPADLVVAQMSPLLKMPLAPVSTTFEYLLLLYHTLVLKAPERQIIFKNVGKL